MIGLKQNTAAIVFMNVQGVSSDSFTFFLGKGDGSVVTMHGTQTIIEGAGSQSVWQLNLDSTDTNTLGPMTVFVVDNTVLGISEYYCQVIP